MPCPGRSSSRYVKPLNVGEPLIRGNTLSDVESGVTAGAQTPVLTKEQVIAIVNDKELCALKPGSDQYKAAFEKKFPSKSTRDSTPAGGMNSEQAETKNDAEGGNTEASVDDDSGKKTIARRKAKDRIGEVIAEREALRAELETLKKGKTPEAAKPQENTTHSSCKFDKRQAKARGLQVRC